MATQNVSVRYGEGALDLRVPATAQILRGAEIPALADPVAAARDALRNPLGARALKTLATERQPQRVAITISDITRPVPNEVLVRAILAELNEAGVRDEQAVIIIATGMHRPSTPEERDRMLGKELQRRVEVIDHRADAADELVAVSDDPPVSMNRRYVEADFKIVTGLIESHFMAGYSGGRKGVCPGLVDLETVQRFHGFKTLADPRAENGVLDGNPCHEIALKVAKKVGVDFLVNVAITHDRQPAGIFAGDMEAAHAAGCAQVERWVSADVDAPYDLVLTSAGGYPLDATFYQTVKGMCGALPLLHEKSAVVIASECREAIGSPECTAMMERWGRDWRGFLNHIETSGRTTKDQWQFQMQARVLAKIGVERLHLVSDGLPLETQAGLGVTPVGGAGQAAERMQAFVDAYLAQHPSARVAVVPEGPYTMLRAAVPASA